MDNIDYRLLVWQKHMLLEGHPTPGVVAGIVHLLDAVQDRRVAELVAGGVPEDQADSQVFGESLEVSARDPRDLCSRCRVFLHVDDTPLCQLCWEDVDGQKPDSKEV